MRASELNVDDISPRSLARRNRRREVPPLIAQWTRDQDVSSQGWFTRWRKSEIASYRLELVISYLSMIAVGITSIMSGIVVFNFTTPTGWLPIWGGVVIAGGLTAAVGALRAGEKPHTRVIRRFNRTELVGSTALFLTLGIYAMMLIILGLGGFHSLRVDSTDPANNLQNLARVSNGVVLMALSVRPAIRMVWLVFRPGKVHESSVILPSRPGTKLE